MFWKEKKEWSTLLGVSRVLYGSLQDELQDAMLFLKTQENDHAMTGNEYASHGLDKLSESDTLDKVVV